MLFVIMLHWHENTQLNDHLHYAATAICQRVNMQLAPMLCGYGNLPAQKYVTCSPPMRLQQFAITKIRDLLVLRLQQFAGAKICNWFDPLKLEAAHEGATMLRIGTRQRHDV
jgi:hypothetical protein